MPWASPVAGAQPELCDACGAVTRDGTEQYAAVPDSSAVDPRCALLDGQRRVVACCPSHLDDLVSYYRARPYDDEELWAYQLTRARRATCGAPDPDPDLDPDLDLDLLAVAAGLTTAQALRAARWQSIWMRWLPERA